MKGRLHIGEDVTADVERRCDVCIIGSGAGGAVLAAGLVERGLDVVMLEEGGYFTRRDFDGDESKAYPALYQDRATRTSADIAITVLQGRSFGGGTTINWTTCYRTPDEILARWRVLHGVDTLAPEILRPHFEAVEERLGIAEWPLSRVNGNNGALLRGCRELGWEVHALKRNVRGCADSGYCGLGCPVGAKQSMHRTYLQDALDLGLEAWTDVRADRIETAADGRAVTAVRASVLDRATGRPTGVKVTVRPTVCVSSCGAINGPALLLRSGLDFNGQVGRRTFLHPVVALAAVHPEPIHPYYGAPQSVASKEFISRGEGEVGFLLETPPIQPVLGALAYSGFGTAATAFMKRLPQVAATLALMADGMGPEAPGGTVSLRKDGRIRLDYPIGPDLRRAMQAGTEAMARIHLAAGAESVHTFHVEPTTLRSEADLPLLADREYGSLKHAIFTAHQMGGCAMGPDPEESVVDTRLRHHELPNLFVVDGSIFPTSLGVNPSETIYAIARWAVDEVAGAV